LCIEVSSVSDAPKVSPEREHYQDVQEGRGFIPSGRETPIVSLPLALLHPRKHSQSERLGTPHELENLGVTYRCGTIPVLSSRRRVLHTEDFYMGKIDDPYDAAKSEYPDAPENIPGELALRIGGAIIPIVGLVNAVRDHYSQARVAERLNVLVDAVNSKTNATNEKIESPQFAEGIRLAIEETWRTTDIEKVKRFGAILGNSAAQGANQDAPRDAVDFIRTVAQLDERDIQALHLLYSNCAYLMASYTNLHDPNPFTDAWAGVVRSADEAKLARDDFYSSCKRLEGFGLAIELPRNPGRIAPGDYSFRPTRRGERLLSLLGYVG
jgi:hypothetical protein